MRVDVVRADEGYFGIYLDGKRGFWGRAEPFHMLALCLKGKTITEFQDHGFGSYGDQAVGWESPADRFEDIPEQWWTDEIYVDPDASNHTIDGYG